jgi:hypothetical protein
MMGRIGLPGRSLPDALRRGVYSRALLAEDRSLDFIRFLFLAFLPGPLPPDLRKGVLNRLSRLGRSPFEF